MLVQTTLDKLPPKIHYIKELQSLMNLLEKQIERNEKQTERIAHLEHEIREKESAILKLTRLVESLIITEMSVFRCEICEYYWDRQRKKEST